MKKLLALLTATALSVTLFAGCGNAGSASSGSSSTTSSEVSGNVTATGSSALAPLVQQAAQDFMGKNSKVSITVNAGGSGAGLNQVAQKSVDIGNSDLYAQEKLSADQAQSLVDHQVCVIGFAAVVNPDVTVSNLTNDQLVSIFTGKTTNWKDVGGADEKITLVGRPSNSGTRATFEKYGLKGTPEDSSIALSSDDSGTLEGYVSKTKGSIGYLALSYLQGKSSVKKVSINGVEPTQENIYSGKYDIWSYEHMYTNGEPAGAVKAFLNYMTGSEFSAKMESLGYNVTSKMKVKHAAPAASSGSSSASGASSASSK